MTDYVETPPQWQAVMWDGTNVQDIVDFLSSLGGAPGATLYVSNAGDELAVLVNDLVVARFDQYLPWLVGRLAGDIPEFRVTTDDSGQPYGFTEV